MRLAGKVAIVTGASQGLGRVFSLRLAAEGAKVSAADINFDGVKNTIQEIEAQGCEGLAIKADVTKEEDLAVMAEKTLAKFGRIDILVNNAAYYYGLQKVPFNKISQADWDKMMAVNVKGPWLCVCAVFPQMQKQGKGKVINVSSGTFFGGSQEIVHYVTSKGGVVGLTRSLARELGDHGICVNALAPGFTDTEASRLFRPKIHKYDVSQNCIKRLAQPEDIAGTVVFLASDDSDFITGQTFLVDGGRIMH